MITPEEWEKLKVGDVIYVGYVLSDTTVIKSTILKITKSQIKLQRVKHFYHQTYNKSQAGCLFTNKLNALEYAVGLLVEQKDSLQRKIERIDSNIEQLKESFKQLEQENGK